MNNTTTDMIIISGLSGSGRSVALQSLEDIGYYCIDNLPAALLFEFSARLLPRIDGSDTDVFPGAAVSIDSRNKNFLSGLDATLTKLGNHGIHYRILFLESEEQKLVRRYSETRRKHPLTDDQTSLIEGIRLERTLLQPLHDRAEKVIDTTDTTVHELRGLIRDFAGAGLSSAPLFLVESFGFKNGTPREADFVFDVRCLPNPYWDKNLAPLTGIDAPVQEFFKGNPEVQDMTIEIFKFVSKWLPGFANENRSYITVAIGCTGGQHRSVYISEQLENLFSKQDIIVQVRHRELAK
ncbi:RNase adapter RapZ [Candidatus Spongiihabitans sp.]|uniref:RNase adapter RapZ n=1 Tax=Candidatus Spongiihabitans sp. TaxID=3101308 RepID=UPI003C6FC63E